jgi:glycosyltransferase involved in cell wall biosynthesis
MLVPPGDIDALAGGLRHLLCNPGTAALLGAAARSTIVESFSLDGAAQAYLNLYSSLSTRGSAS